MEGNIESIAKPETYSPPTSSWREGGEPPHPDTPAFTPDTPAFTPDTPAFTPDTPAFTPDEKLGNIALGVSLDVPEGNPQLIYKDGDRLYVACIGKIPVKRTGPNQWDTKVEKYCCRDWRFTLESSQYPERHAHGIDGWYGDLRRKNLAENHRIHQSIRGLKGAHAGRTAYVMGAGPSILKNIKENPPRHGDIVFAANRSISFAPFPVDYYVVGDALVDEERIKLWRKEAVEAGYATRLDYDMAVGFTKVLMEQWASPDLRRMFGDENCYYFREAGHPKSANVHELGVNSSLPGIEHCFNTGSMMLNICDYMGFSRIVFVGFDCAYTNEMRYPGERAGISAHTAYMVSESIAGGITITDSAMWVLARKMETWAYMLAGYGVECVNLTGAGILDRYFEKERS